MNPRRMREKAQIARCHAILAGYDTRKGLIRHFEVSEGKIIAAHIALAATQHPTTGEHHRQAAGYSWVL